MDLFDLAHSLHEQHLRESEKRQRYRKIALDSPPFRKRLLMRLGDALIRYGNWLKAYPAVQAQYSVNRPKLEGTQ